MLATESGRASCGRWNSPPSHCWVAALKAVLPASSSGKASQIVAVPESCSSFWATANSTSTPRVPIRRQAKYGIPSGPAAESPD